jgi:hypothetical protein
MEKAISKISRAYPGGEEGVAQAAKGEKKGAKSSEIP